MESLSGFFNSAGVFLPISIFLVEYPFHYRGFPGGGGPCLQRKMVIWKCFTGLQGFANPYDIHGFLIGRPLDSKSATFLVSAFCQF